MENIELIMLILTTVMATGFLASLAAVWMVYFALGKIRCGAEEGVLKQNIFTPPARVRKEAVRPFVNTDESEWEREIDRGRKHARTGDEREWELEKEQMRLKKVQDQIIS